MKKNSWIMTLLLALFAINVNAFEVGEYAYTATQRLKITGENMAQNGNFAEGLTSGGWCGLTLAEPVSSTTWKVVDGEGPNGESVLQSQGATADEPLCNVWSGLYEGQTYMVSFMIKGEGAGVTTVGTTVGNNYCDFFLNSDGSLTHATSTDEAPVVNVATAANFTNEWQTVSFVFTPTQGQQLVMHFEKLATNTMITNFSIHQVTETYDDRIVRRKMAFAQRIMADPNFKNSQTEDAYDNFYYGVYSYVEDQLGTSGAFDDPYGSASLMEQFDGELAAFMEASAPDMATEENFKYITDLTAFPKYNRGKIADGQVIGGFKFRGENWQHPSGDVLVKQIQGSFKVGPGSVALYNQDFTSGKYYIAAEVRNAYCDAKYNLTWNMERDVKLFIGTDTLDCGIISGQDFQKFYMVGNLKEGETFEAGVYWDGPQGGGRFEVKNFEVRGFGDAVDQMARNKAWKEFITQWNAVVHARDNARQLQNDGNYPWGKDSLQRAFNQWDAYYNEVITKGWVTADGKDTGVATNEELVDWTTYHGVEMYDGDGNLLKYQLVRGYQDAINYVKTENQAIMNLLDEIGKAELLRDDDMNQQGDKTTFQRAIDAAKNTLNTTLATTTDATREADEAAVNAAIETLQTAEETFKNSVPEMAPIIDIDFSNNFEPVYTVTPGAEGEDDVTTLTGYTIKGAVGQMDFTIGSVTDNGDGSYANDQTTFALGCGGAEATNTDVLRVGKGMATVDLAESDIPTDAEVLRVNFDVWFGGLINRNVEIQLQNAAGERVAGFSYCLYGGTCAYNDFLNAEGKGLDIAACGKYGKDADANLLVDKYKWQFDIIVDYKAKTVQANLLTSPTGAKNADPVALNTTLSDNKIAKFVLSSNYDNTSRRSWFDNLKIIKYSSSANDGDSIENDVTHYIVNAGFDEDLTFQVDGTMKELVSTNTSLSDRSWAYIAADSTVYARPKESSPQQRTDGRSKLDAVNGFHGRTKGWTLTGVSFPNCEWTYFGTVPYELPADAVPIGDDGSNYLLVPEKPEGLSDNGNKGLLYMRAGWNNSCVYKQEVTLPCAVYRIEYWTINLNPNSTATATDMSQITCRGEVFKDEEGTGLSSKEWVKHEFEFTATSTFTIQFGYKAANSSSNSNPWVCLDGIKLYKIGEADSEELINSDLYAIENRLQELQTVASEAGMERLANEISDYYLGFAEIKDNGSLSDKEAAVKEGWSKVSNFSEAIDVAKRLDEIVNRMLNILYSYDYSNKEAFMEVIDRITGYYVNGTSQQILGAEAEAEAAILEYENGGQIAEQVSVPYIQTVTNETFTFPVSAHINREYVAFQMDIQLPWGITPVMNEDGSFAITKNDERMGQSHVVSANFIEGQNLLKLVCNSLQNEAFVGQDGELFSLQLKASPDMSSGYYSYALSNIKFSTSSLAAGGAKGYYMGSTRGSIYVKQLLNSLTVTDDYWLNTDESPFDIANPDINVTMYDRGQGWWEPERYQFGALFVDGDSLLSLNKFQITIDPYAQWVMKNYGYDGNRASGVLINNAPMRANTVSANMRLQAYLWHFISLPFDVKVSDIAWDNANQLFAIYKYDGMKRANMDMDSTWVRMTADSTLQAGVGYIWQVASNYNESTGEEHYDVGLTVTAENSVNKNNIFRNENVSVQMAEYLSEYPQDRSWNLLGNPYPAYVESRAMNITAPFTVWNVQQQNYEAFSPVDDNYVFAPGEAFFFQRPLEQGSIIFHKDGRREACYSTGDSYFYQARRVAPSAERYVFNLTLTGNEQSDRSRFVINSEATLNYELDKDASKFTSLSADALQLYTIEQGVRYAINERPFSTGVVAVGINIGKKGTYTLKLQTNTDDAIYVEDHLTGTESLLGEEGYTFESKAGNYDNRFKLRIGAGQTTGIKNIGNAIDSAEKKFYRLDGVRVKKPTKGVFIENGKKVVVK